MERRSRVSPTIVASAGATVFAAVELSKTSWLVAIYRPSCARTSRHRVKAGDAGRLLELLEHARQQEEQTLGEVVSVCCCYEAGYDGFWLHRRLEQAGIAAFVIDPTSLLIDRRARRAKTDGLDVDGLLRSLIAWLQGDGMVCRMIRVPDPGEEDARRSHRERQRLLKERVGHVNRIKGLLATQGIYNYQPLRRDRDARLEALVTADGQPLPPRLKGEIRRELARLELVLDQIRTVEAERDAATADEADAQAAMMTRLMHLRGIGVEGATILAREIFYRDFDNRRELAAYAGLTPSPFESGGLRRTQGISKAGNGLVRKTMVELAWFWLRFQPDSALSSWFRQRTGQLKGRPRRIGIVALARKLLIALWRFATAGVLPEGAVLKAA